MAAPRYSAAVAPKVETMVLQFAGDYDTTIAEVGRFVAPYDGRLAYLSVTAQAESGTTPTLEIDVQQGATSLLDSAVAVTVGADTEATLAADASFAKDAAITVDFTIGGTTPVFSHVTLTMVMERND